MMSLYLFSGDLFRKRNEDPSNLFKGMVLHQFVAAYGCIRMIEGNFFDLRKNS